MSHNGYSHEGCIARVTDPSNGSGRTESTKLISYTASLESTMRFLSSSHLQQSILHGACTNWVTKELRNFIAFGGIKNSYMAQDSVAHVALKATRLPTSLYIE